MAKLPTPEIDIKEKVFNLYTELVQAKKDKKETVKAHSDNVKRIEDEIKELLDQEEEDVKNSQKSVDE
jgi:gas vesicle protein